MASIVQICNIALSRTGQSQRIDSLTERSLAAEVCALHYDNCRDLALSEFDWPFAETRVALADIGSPTGAWQYRYRYPTDCLKARYIAVPGAEVVPFASRITFKVANAVGGRSILSNQPEAELVYTARVEDTTYYTPAFVSALAWLLCAEIASPMKAAPQVYAAAYQAYRMTVGQAAALAFEESEEGEMPASEFQRVRG